MLLRPTGLFLGLCFLLLAPGLRAEELPPPEVCWRKGPRALGVRVTAADGSHLNSSLPLRLLLDDGTYFLVRWSQPVDGDEAIVRLPRVAGEDSEGWTLEIRGGVCNEDASVCLPFWAQDDVPRRGRRRGRLTAERGPRPGAPPEEPDQPAEPGEPDQPAEPEESEEPGGAREADSAWFHVERGELEAAFETARAGDRNLLVDFWAGWCPPCDRLRDEFLDDPRRLGLLSAFVLVKADADHPGSFQLKDRYRVGGYPTMLVLDPQGRELDRIVGYHGQAELLATRLAGLKEARGWDDPPPDAEPIEVLRRLLAADLEEEAEAFLLAMDPPPAEAWAGDYAALELAWTGLEVGPAEDRLTLARALADAAPTPGLAATWADSLAQLHDEEFRTDEREAVEAEFEQRLAAVLGSRTGVAATIGPEDRTLAIEVPFQRPDVLDDFATAARIRGAWLDSEEEHLAHMERRRLLWAEGSGALAAALVIDEATRGPLVQGPTAGTPIRLTLPDDLLREGRREALARHEGRVHEMVGLLDDAGLPDVSEPIRRAMTGLFPEDFTWHYALARFLREQRGGDGALEPARAALAASYGDNRLRAARLLAEVLRDGGLVAEALTVVEEALATPAPEQQNVRTHRYRKALEDLRTSLLPSEPR